MATQPYDASFFAGQSGGSYASARVVLGEVQRLLPFRSACDVGCGAGTWLRALAEMGVEDLMGLDGAYARSSLQVPAERFRATDLAAPFTVERGFDLALSLEVAEHLPPRRAESFVEDLVRLAPAVLFSAAVPGQGGTQHLNERWQDYWVELFARHGYAAHDVIRPRIWNEAVVEPWYRQNTLLFLREGHPQEEAVRAAWQPLPASVVHPALFPLGANVDNKVLLLRFLYWSFARDARRLRARFLPRAADPGRTSPASG